MFGFGGSRWCHGLNAAKQNSPVSLVLGRGRRKKREHVRRPAPGVNLEAVGDAVQWNGR